MSLASEIRADLSEIASDLGNPTFTWQTKDYVGIPSMADNDLALDVGGFTPEKLLNITVRRYDEKNNPTFPNDNIPQAQQLIVYKKENFRIRMTKQHPTDSYIRLVCVSEVRGI